MERSYASSHHWNTASGPAHSVSGFHRRPPLESAGNLQARDAGRKPQRSGGVASQHVAEVMDAEVEPAESDGADQDDRAGHRGDLELVAAFECHYEEIGEHPVGHQRAHRMAA